MLALELVIGLVVLAGLAVALGVRMPTWVDEPDDVRDNGLPDDRLLRSDDIPRLRFRVGWRGYHMSDVDAALEAARLALATAEGGGAVSPAAAHPSDAELAEQPPGDSDQPLSDLEDSWQTPDDR